MDFLDRLISFVGMGLNKAQIKGASVVSWRLVVVFSVLSSWGYLASFGVPGFAFASDVEKLTHKLSGIERKQDTGLALQISDRIRTLVYARCGTTGEARAEFSRQIEEWQVQYVAVSPGNSRYPEPSCN